MDIDGTYYKAHDAISEPLDVPVMASALQRGSFELCGEEADGAISWICPARTCAMWPSRPCRPGPSEQAVPCRPSLRMRRSAYMSMLTRYEPRCVSKS